MPIYEKQAQKSKIQNSKQDLSLDNQIDHLQNLSEDS